MEKMGLEGFRVIDFTTAEAGPICSEYLALLGMSVVRVELPPKKELTKGEKARFIATNLNKKSVTLDYTTPEGKAKLKKLLETADVFVENRPFGFMEELGLGYETVKAFNPRIVWCAIKPYPKGSPWQDAAWDCSTISAITGATYVSGYLGNPPVEPGPTLADTSTCGYSALCIIGALYERETTGEGSYMEAIMQEAVIAQGRSCIEKYHSFNRSGRIGNGFPTMPMMSPIGMFHTKGGGEQDFVLIACLEEHMVNKCFAAMGREDLIGSPKFDTMEHRNENLEELMDIISAFAIQHDKFEIMELLLGKNRIISSAVFTPDDIINSQDLRDIGALRCIKDEELGEMWMPGCPAIYHDIDTPAVSPGRPGAANAEILGALE